MYGGYFGGFFPGFLLGDVLGGRLRRPGRRRRAAAARAAISAASAAATSAAATSAAGTAAAAATSSPRPPVQPVSTALFAAQTSSMRHLIVVSALALVLAAPAAAGSLPLVGYWPMYEGQGQIVHDLSGMGNNGVLGASAAAEPSDPTWIRGGLFGALHFSGSQYVTVPDSPALAPARVTVLGLVRGSSSPGQWRYVFSKGSLGCVERVVRALSRASAAGWLSTSRTARTASSSPRRRPFRSGTANGTWLQGRSTGRRCACSWTEPRSERGRPSRSVLDRLRASVRAVDDRPVRRRLRPQLHR